MRPPLALSLFWRTFALLALLLTAGVLAWVQTLRWLELEPRAIEQARQMAGLVNLTRASLEGVDGIERVTRLKSMGHAGRVHVRPREPADQVLPYAVDRFTTLVQRELQSELGQDTLMARRVNGERGLWMDVSLGQDRYWLHLEDTQPASVAPGTWAAWWTLTLLATALGSAAITRLINRPLRELSFAASRIREGMLDSRLDEATLTSEIREVNRGFNRMARELARVEEDRAVMLAGISHDLRTPLARLRLEAEMSVVDDEARRNMAADIDQLSAIVGQFMDYARPGSTTVRPVLLAALVDREAANFRDPGEIRITSQLAIDLRVMADEVELGRVFLNLFENARRYGRRGQAEPAQVTLTYARDGPWVVVDVVDQGPGVPSEKLRQLTTPFYRGDAARTSAKGAGLGLAIVEKALLRMGGGLELANATGGGLLARLRLRRAP